MVVRTIYRYLSSGPIHPWHASHMASDNQVQLPAFKWRNCFYWREKERRRTSGVTRPDFRAGGARQSWQIAYLIEGKLRIKTYPALCLGPLMGKAMELNREENSEVGITKAVWCWIQHHLTGNSWGVSGPKRSALFLSFGSTQQEIRWVGYNLFSI